MSSTTTADIIKYWDERVQKYGQGSEATLLDANMRALELETVQNWLSPTDRVLDIFCASAIATVELVPHCAHITGVDFSPEMVKAGKERVAQQGLGDRVDIQFGNVVELASIFKPGQFDVVTSIRGLINLPTWELQKQALEAVHSLLPTGGRLLFLEGSIDGLEKINTLRAQFSLPELKEPWYDKHFRRAPLDELMTPLFDLTATRDLSTYFLLSRVLYPLAAQPAAPSFDSQCNTLARLAVPYLSNDQETTLLFCHQYTKK